MLLSSESGSVDDVFDCIPPYKQEELFRPAVHKVIVSEGSMERALYGKPPRLSEITQGTARSGTSNWLPGLVSQSAILRDLSELTWRRLRHGRITLTPT
jgi:hypothetical protein